MAGTQRRGGMIEVKVAGVMYDAKGNFTYNLGRGKKTAIEGAAAMHGYSEKPQVAFIEGEITDKASLDLGALIGAEDVTVTLTLGNGKVIVWRDAYFAGEGTGNTEEGNVDFRFESSAQAEELS